MKISDFSSALQSDVELMRIHGLISKATRTAFFWHIHLSALIYVPQALHKYPHMQEPSGTIASSLLCVQHSKTIDPIFFFTVELYGMIAYATQGNRNGHTELQY